MLDSPAAYSLAAGGVPSVEVVPAGQDISAVPESFRSSTIAPLAPVRTSKPAELLFSPATGSALPQSAAPTAIAIELLPARFNPPTSAIGAHSISARLQPRNSRSLIAIIFSSPLKRIHPEDFRIIEPAVDRGSIGQPLDTGAQGLDVGALPCRRADPLAQISAHRRDLHRGQRSAGEIRLDHRPQHAARLSHPEPGAVAVAHQISSSRSGR